MKASGEIKLFIGITIVAIALVAVAIMPVFLQKQQEDLGSKVEYVTTNRPNLIPRWAVIRGDPKAPYSLVEFGDYQCPSCKAGKTVVDHALEKYKNRLNFVFHNYRINPAHANSMILAAAVQAAAQQGKYWEMHDAIFDHQDAFTIDDDKTVLDALTKLASNLKLDVLRFRSALTGREAIDGAQRPGSLAEQLKITNTPTYFFIGKDGKVRGIYTNDRLQKFFESPDPWK